MTTRTELSSDAISQLAKMEDTVERLHLLRSISADLMQKFAFPELSPEIRKDVSELFIAQFPLSSENLSYQCALLELVRILSRDKTGINFLFSNDLVDLVLDAAGIKPQPQTGNQTRSFSVVVEAVKCLVNALFNSVVARTAFEVKCHRVLVQRIDVIRRFLENHPDAAVGSDFVEAYDYLNAVPRISLEGLFFFDLRIAFVSSAHSIDLQKMWIEDLYAAEAFLNVLKYALTQKSNDASTDWATESLKILFNIFCHAQVYDVTFAQDCANVCAGIITAPDNNDDLKQNAVHLLATMTSTLPDLCQKLSDELTNDKSYPSYDGYDMKFVDAMLQLMDRKVEKTDKGEVDLLSTFFTTLIYLCKNNKFARRFCRLKVLPPLKASHVERPPTEGQTLRNKLVRLMMSPANCRDLAAEFLFVLCKRSVGRLIKYTGFGHSAGLLANYGFLGSINEPKHPSDSEDSDTDSYKEVEDQVNPVAGYIIPKGGINPLDQMTDEQKEYEAMKLANAMSKLLEEGIVVPGTIGADGKPTPVSHVNELVKNVHVPEEKSSGSESD